MYFKWNKVEWKGVFQNGILLFFFFGSVSSKSGDIINITLNIVMVVVL